MKRNYIHKNDENKINVNKKLKDDNKNNDIFYWNNERHVRPYDYDFKCYSKGRWVGKTLFNVYKTEFIRYTSEYFRCAILSGRITVNNKVVNLDYKIKQGDEICHTVHRHEPPIGVIAMKSIPIILENDQYLVINKPINSPLHPCGRYNKNCIQHILLNEYNINIYPVHRLDQATTGIVIFAKTKDTATKFGQDMKNKKFNKIYVARVKGKFPQQDNLIVKKPIRYDNKVLGTQKVDERGKLAETHFKFISYDNQGDTTLIECRPITGRTHQIRVHLNYIGYPIANDPLYGGQLYESNCKRGKYQDDMSSILKLLKIEDDFKINVCDECKIGSYWNDDTPYCTYIWLHALKYECGEEIGSFETELPNWAKKEFNSKKACEQSVPFNFTKI